MIALSRTGVVLADPSWNGGWNHGGGGGGWWWIWLPIGIVFWITVVAVVGWVVMRRVRPAQQSPLDRSRQILHERYARGEIDTEEYQQRLDHLT